MKKLLKSYGFTSNRQYFEMIAESVVNGQRTQAKEQFLAMPKSERKEFVNFNLGNSESVLENSDLATFITLI